MLGGLNGQSIARRLTAVARAAGIEGRITGHSGRVGLASELTTRGASITENDARRRLENRPPGRPLQRRGHRRAGRRRQVPLTAGPPGRRPNMAS